MRYRRVGRLSNKVWFGFWPPLALAGLIIGGGLFAGSLLLLISGILLGIDLGAVSVILAAPKAQTAGQAATGPRKIHPAIWVIIAFGAGTISIMAATIRLTRDPGSGAGEAVLILTALSALMVGVYAYLFSSRGQYGFENLRRALLNRSCRIGFYRQLVVFLALAASRLWHPAIELVVAQAMGIAILNLGLEINWTQIENPFDLHRGSRLRKMLLESEEAFPTGSGDKFPDINAYRSWWST